MTQQNENKQNETKIQTERIRELFKRYVAFKFIDDESKKRTIHLCGILSYLEAAKRKNMDLDECIVSIEEFLEKLRTKYMGDNTSDTIIDELKKGI